MPYRKPSTSLPAPPLSNCPMMLRGSSKPTSKGFGNWNDLAPYGRLHDGPDAQGFAGDFRDPAFPDHGRRGHDYRDASVDQGEEGPVADLHRRRPVHHEYGAISGANPVQTHAPGDRTASSGHDHHAQNDRLRCGEPC